MAIKPVITPHFLTCKNAALAEGVVVVIDVLRAFTTAAVAFDQGAERIYLTDSVEDAQAVKRRFSQALLLGEVGGMPIPGFDLGNSPVALLGLDLRGRTIVMRTSNGTKGVVAAVNASSLFVSSFVVAGATAKQCLKLVQFSSEKITSEKFTSEKLTSEKHVSEYSVDKDKIGENLKLSFVITGETETNDGQEDRACADYLTELLNGSAPEFRLYEQRVRESSWAAKFTDSSEGSFPRADLELSVELDRFDFAMQVTREQGLLCLQKV